MTSTLAPRLGFGLSLLLVSLTAVASLGTARAEPPPLDAAQWTKVFGTAAEGWSPTVVAGLRDGMTPDAAGKVLAGADKMSKHGFAKFALKGVPGVARVELYYHKAKGGTARTLANVTLVLDPRAMSESQTYAALISVLEAKYGKAKKADAVANKQITWVGSGQSVQLWKVGRDLTFIVRL